MAGPLLESLRALRNESADISDRLDVAEAVARIRPNPRALLTLNHRLGRRVLEAHSDWLEEVERELGS